MALDTEVMFGAVVVHTVIMGANASVPRVVVEKKDWRVGSQWHPELLNQSWWSPTLVPVTQGKQLPICLATLFGVYS